MKILRRILKIEEFQAETITTIYNHNSAPFITHFWQLLRKNEEISSVHTAYDNGKVASQVLYYTFSNCFISIQMLSVPKSTIKLLHNNK